MAKMYKRAYMELFPHSEILTTKRESSPEWPAFTANSSSMAIKFQATNET